MNKTIKWRELPRGIYAIKDSKQMTTKFGDTVVLMIETEDGTAYKVWAPNRLAKQLTSDPGARYVRNMGLRESANNPAKSYFDFDIL